VGLAPAMSAGSSVANSSTPLSDSTRSSLSALNVSRPDRSMSSHTTAANRGSGEAASRSRSAMPPSRGSPAAANCSHELVWDRSSRSMPPDSTSQNQAVITNPAGSQSWQARNWRRSEDSGSCICNVDVRASTATGTGADGAGLVMTWNAGVAVTGGAGAAMSVAPGLLGPGGHRAGRLRGR
jgi:hypothetical protein